MVNFPPPDRLTLVPGMINLPDPCFASTDPAKYIKTAGDGSQTPDANKFLPDVRYLPLKFSLPLLDQLPDCLNRMQREGLGSPLPTWVVRVAR